MAGYGNFAYYYDRLTYNVDYEQLSGYIYNLLAENGIDKGIFLDLACGTGSLSMLMSEKGFDVIGVDGSEDMLSVANEKRIQSGQDIMYLRQNMEDLDLFGTIDAAVCILDSINHVTDIEKVREIFRRVSLFMNDKGIFVFDVNTPFKHKNILGNNTFVYDLDDVYCVWQNTFHEKELETEVCLDVFERDEQEDIYYKYSESFFEKAYDLIELQNILEEHKFEVLGIYDGMTKNKITKSSERAVFVLKKHGTQ